MEIKIKYFLGREHFQWSGGDANQPFIFIWPNYLIFNNWDWNNYFMFFSFCVYKNYTKCGVDQPSCHKKYNSSNLIGSFNTLIFLILAAKSSESTQ